MWNARLSETARSRFAPPPVLRGGANVRVSAIAEDVPMVTGCQVSLLAAFSRTLPSHIDDGTCAEPSLAPHRGHRRQSLPWLINPVEAL